jgi:hypothetical protein
MQGYLWQAGTEAYSGWTKFLLCPQIPSRLVSVCIGVWSATHNILVTKFLQCPQRHFKLSFCSHCGSVSNQNEIWYRGMDSVRSLHSCLQTWSQVFSDFQVPTQKRINKSILIFSLPIDCIITNFFPTSSLFWVCEFDIICVSCDPGNVFCKIVVKIVTLYFFV